MAAGEGYVRSRGEDTQWRTEKVLQHKVLAEPTEHHPAQIETWYEDRRVARIDKIHLSSAWTPSQKSEALARVDTLLRAVKKARQKANTAEVVRTHDATINAITHFILNG